MRDGTMQIYIEDGHIFFVGTGRPVKIVRPINEITKDAPIELEPSRDINFKVNEKPMIICTVCKKEIESYKGHHCVAEGDHG
ncbi:MAG: hypothetical protein KAR06_05610 [Deltaproteobacteria bacterium]|nr:hypothetical protein [Deltaproteobacteria bacterium]